MPDYRFFLADVVAGLHALYSLFVLLGLVWLINGFFLKGKGAPGKAFRTLHLLAVLALLLRLALGMPCPFSVLENHLRGDVLSHSRTIIVLHRIAFRNANASNFHFSTIFVGLFTLAGNLFDRVPGFVSCSRKAPRNLLSQ